jgi:hypothetical protein
LGNKKKQNARLLARLKQEAIAIFKTSYVALCLRELVKKLLREKKIAGPDVEVLSTA